MINQKRLKGKPSLFKGKKFSSASRKKLSDSLKKSYADKKIEHWTHKKSVDEIKEIYRNAGIRSSISRKGTILSKEHKHKISVNNARFWKGKHLSEETKKLLSKIRIEKLKSGSLNVRVSKTEAMFGDAVYQKFGVLLQPSFWLEGKCFDYRIPDRNILIECDGDYWHRDKTMDCLKNEIAKSNGFEIIRLKINKVNDIDEAVNVYQKELKKYE